jgi:hypothetical protein
MRLGYGGAVVFKPGKIDRDAKPEEVPSLLAVAQIINVECVE